MTLSSEAEQPDQRAKLIHKLQKIVSTAAAKNANIIYKQGEISLSPEEKSSFSFSSSYGNYSNSSSNFYILSELDTNKDLFIATQHIYNFMKSLQKPEDTKLDFGNTSLAVESPNKYRNKLLEKIKNEIAVTKNILGAKYKASVSGLENPVIVKQKNGSQVTLFINYQVTYKEPL